MIDITKITTELKAITHELQLLNKEVRSIKQQQIYFNDKIVVLMEKKVFDLIVNKTKGIV